MSAHEHHPLTKHFERGIEAFKLLSKSVFDGLKPPSGAYAFFNHNAHAMSALQDCERIYTRLDKGRKELTRLAYLGRSAEPKDWPPGVPLPEETQAVMREESRVNEHMKLDLESLYVFGGVLLDQWALQAIAVGNVTCAKQHPFRELVEFLEDHPESVLQPLWQRLQAQMLWLYYQLRFYRNKFIIHADRPWQRGTTRSVYGDDFNLFIPTPPGWLDDKALDQEISELMHLAPDHIQRSRTDYWERKPGRLIEILFDEIARFSKADRRKVAQLFSKKGGSTPNFRTLALRLADFVANGTEDLVPIAEQNLQNIDIGKPHRTSADMWNDRASDED